MFVGKRRVDDFSTYCFKDIATNITSPTVVFKGEIEARRYPELFRRTKDAIKFIKHARLIMIQSGEHNIGQEEYREAVVCELMCKN